MKRVLELFSGTHSVGKIAKENYEVISLDIELGDKHNISNHHIEVDIMNWNYKHYPPHHFHIIWASPVCTWWSLLRQCNIGKSLKLLDGEVLTREILENDILTKGVPMVDKVMEIIQYFKPNFYFIENPQTGRMKEYINFLPYYDVDYCKYSNYGYRKRTRIWTNIEGFTPLLCKKDCGYTIGKRHIVNVGDVTSCLNGKHYPRYRIPEKLIRELFKFV